MNNFSKSEYYRRSKYAGRTAFCSPPRGYMLNELFRALLQTKRYSQISPCARLTPRLVEMTGVYIFTAMRAPLLSFRRNAPPFVISTGARSAQRRNLGASATDKKGVDRVLQSDFSMRSAYATLSRNDREGRRTLLLAEMTGLYISTAMLPSCRSPIPPLCCLPVCGGLCCRRAGTWLSTTWQAQCPALSAMIRDRIRISLCLCLFRRRARH